MNARASLYTAEIADHILGELRVGRSLLDICLEDGMPHRDTVNQWIRQDRDGFAARYREARGIAQSVPGYPGYTAATADRVLEELMGGRHLIDVCSDPDMPDHTTVNRWVATDREGFAARYRSARQVGRLSRAEMPFTPENAELVLDELSAGRTLEDICADPDMPSEASVRRWTRNDPEGFGARVREAREEGCLALAGQTLRIVDDRRNDWITWRREDGTLARMLDPHRVNRALARVKTRYQLIAKMEPKPSGGRPEADARQAASDDMAEFMKLLNGRDRGLPSEDEPLDER
jgi:uncharacterized protein (UPF0147 family)